MTGTNVLQSILLQKYGIKDMKELDAAIKKQGGIDVTVFCGHINKKTTKGETYGQRNSDSIPA